VSKFNTSSLPLRGILPVKQKHHLEGSAVPAGHCDAHNAIRPLSAEFGVRVSS